MKFFGSWIKSRKRRLLWQVRGGKGLSISVFGFANRDIKYLEGVLKKFLPNRPLTSGSFFFLKKVANIEAKRAIIAVFILLLSSSSLFLFLHSLSFASVIIELIGRKKPAF